MTTIYNKIYKKAEVYWDTRGNDDHVPGSYDFAKRLLAYYPEADESIVLPAILLHDVGWKIVPEEKHLNAFGPKATDTVTNRLHETEGVKIAEKILISLNYDADKIEEILSIIDGHDSRLEALSLNDKLVKDADKLFRYTPVGVDFMLRCFGFTFEDRTNFLDTMIESWFFTPAAKEMARAALAETKLKHVLKP